ncbi:nuclease (SNase) [Minwuia thermotolerans]|uniref:Nuclease (SNase) n=2 Tax=Minwuia thermotolerans TaxID=2056226 RepID=A0A2M9FZE2_9PROT|nr:nuclease (SNase) [Minwuia thermotolerans]
MIALMIGLLAALPALAGDPGDLPGRVGGAVTEVVDGDTLFLEDGTEVRLVGIQAPKLPLGRAGFRKWPLADEAKATLESLVAGRRFDLHFGGRRLDRHGRSLAHMVTADGFWLQGEMLRLGMARVYSFPDNRALVEEMLALEQVARQGRYGIWSHPFYAVRSPEELGGNIGTFQIVKGMIADAARVRGTLYLNFGADWREDFTVAIDRSAGRLFPDTTPAIWRDRTIRVRGWVRSRNGPMIEASHPEQIEIVGE